MRLFYSSIASRACIATLFRAASSAPDLAFPINSQVPPVAYASQSYQFSFSESTFRSDAPIVSYSLSNAPSWLFLDSDRRSFGGNPTPSDVGASTFHLRASDGNNEATSEVTLIVLEKDRIALGASILPHLDAAGTVSAPSALLLKPLELFSLTFSTDNFSGTSASTKYYAISANSSPLPPWIHFDETKLSFFGTSPPLVSPSAQQQLYGISLIASDVPGFAEATINFHLAIAYRTLAFSAPIFSLSVMRGSPFLSPRFRESLRLDGKPIEPSELASVSADSPNWMQMDSQDMVFSGTSPSDVQSVTFLLSVADIYGNMANVTVKLEANEDDGSSSVEVLDATATAGEAFSYTLPQSAIGFSAELVEAPRWLTFSAENSTLHGHVPDDLQAQDVTVRLISGTKDDRKSIQLSIHVIGPVEISSRSVQSTASTSTTSRLPVPTEQTRADDGSDEAQTKPKHIIFIVLITVLLSLFVLFCILFLIFWWRRRAKQRDLDQASEAQEEEEEEEEEGEESRDVPQVRELEIPDTVELPPIANSSRKTSVGRFAPIHAPQVDLPWAPDSMQKTRARLSKRQRATKQGSFDSSWSGLVPRPSIRSGDAQTAVGHFEWQLAGPSSPPPLPANPAKRQSGATKASSSRKTTNTQERTSKALSTANNRQVGLPQRLSGAGHGAGILPVESANHRSSWQTTLGSIPLVDSRPGTRDLEAFPNPPSEGKENLVPKSAANVTKPSLRLVDPSSEASESFEIQRQHWHTERARDRLEGVARFSNAGSSRSVSLPRPIASSTFSPSRTISPTIPEHGTYRTQARDPSWSTWSKWSGIGPAGRTESPLSARVPTVLFTRPTPRILREISVASSGQFDSALSSESQGEDENLISGINEAGELQWHTDTDSAAPSPRLPFETTSSQEEVGSARQVGMSKGARLIDKRRRVSLGNGDIHRSEKSHAGSFRFI